MFGLAKKFSQTENDFRWPWNIKPWSVKSFTLVFYLQMISGLRHPKRERERARRESRESELDRTRSHHRPNPSSHWSCRTPALLRSRRQDRTPDRIAKIALLPPPSRLNSRRLNLDAPQANAGLRSPLTLRSPSHLYNTRSTSLQTHLPILLFSFLM